MNRLNELEFVNNWCVVKHLYYADETETIGVGIVIKPDFLASQKIYYKRLFSSKLIFNGEELVLVSNGDIIALVKEKPTVITWTAGEQDTESHNY